LAGAGRSRERGGALSAFSVPPTVDTHRWPCDSLVEGTRRDGSISPSGSPFNFKRTASNVLRNCAHLDILLTYMGSSSFSLPHQFSSYPSVLLPNHAIDISEVMSVLGASYTSFLVQSWPGKLIIDNDISPSFLSAPRYKIYLSYQCFFKLSSLSDLFGLLPMRHVRCVKGFFRPWSPVLFICVLRRS
jgi:hypothetical protein